jgi:hypothetical protein
VSIVVAERLQPENAPYKLVKQFPELIHSNLFIVVDKKGFYFEAVMGSINWWRGGHVKVVVLTP